jgi:membrane protein
VAALGFLLMVSLVVSAALTAFGNYLNSVLPFGKLILTVLNEVVSLILISILFAAIYKVLPDRALKWRDVITGAVVTALLFTIGKTLIGLYLGSSAVASSYGAASALIVLLLWVYYSAQIFLLGAEFTKVFTEGYKEPGDRTSPVRRGGQVLTAVASCCAPDPRHPLVGRDPPGVFHVMVVIAGCLL